MTRYYEWANDADVRKYSINSEPISLDTHKAWFQNKLHEPNCIMLLMENEKIAVGQIRFDINNDVVHIDYSIDKQSRGRNWGEILLVQGMRIICANKTITFKAEVKHRNLASVRIFQKQGFEESDNNSSDIRVFQKHYSIKDTESTTLRYLE